jgi:hypothetical protein
MRRGTMNRIRNERGVAMMTVIYVAAVLTVVSSTATFLTIKEFRAGVDDRRGAEALSYAESGVDRLMLKLRTENLSWNRINEAGCAKSPLTVPKGYLGDTQYYNSYLTVFDARPGLSMDQRLPDLGSWTKPGDSWPVAGGPADSSEICTLRNGVLPDPEQPQYFAISSTGEHPTAKRVVRQVLAIRAKGLPIGLYAINVNVQGGNPSTLDISLVAKEDVVGREKLAFSGFDPYYKMGHFWDGASMTQAAPAAVHARGTIYCKKNNCGDDLIEHPTAVECDANSAGTAWQALYDQSGWTTRPVASAAMAAAPSCGSPLTKPPYSSFDDEDLARSAPRPELDEQDLQALKAGAQSMGLYCRMSGNSGTCSTPTRTFTTNGTIQDSDVAEFGGSYIAYFEYDSGNPGTVTWKAPSGPCSDDENIHQNTTIVVRHGGLDLTGKDEIVGLFLAPEGKIWMRGSGGIVKIHGTAIADEIDLGGNAEVKLSDCWVENMPTPTLRITPISWSEVDR